LPSQEIVFPVSGETLIGISQALHNFKGNYGATFHYGLRAAVVVVVVVVFSRENFASSSYCGKVTRHVSSGMKKLFM
jgi:hypothetical protein